MYSVVAGDTFEKIARKQYGDEKQAFLISSANPGATEPLVPGTSLVIPSQPGAPTDKTTQVDEVSENEVALLIDGERFRFWEDMRIVRSMDRMDVLEITAPLNVDDLAFRQAFAPFSYRDMTVTVGGSPLFTGTMVGVAPSVTPNSRTVGVSAYSKPGVLNDCSAPASAYPIEFNNQSLQDIATTLCQPFGLSPQFDADQGEAFDRIAASVTEKLLSFLTKLAQQRGLVISSTEQGALLFQKSISTGNPVANLTQGASPLMAANPAFNPQTYYSHVTGIDAVIVGREGAQFTVKNEKLPGTIRPFTFNTPDVSGGGVKASTEAKAGRMFANAASYVATVSTWRDPQGNLWRPNTTLFLQAPDAMVYNPYEFLIRSVTFDRTADSETASLELVFPGSFNGKAPETLPWEE